MAYHHELCHRKQNNQNRLNERGFLRFIDEMECTVKMGTFLIKDKTKEGFENCKVVVGENKKLVDCEEIREEFLKDEGGEQ